MRSGEFLSALLDRGIRLWVEGDQLKFRAPAGALTPALRLEIAGRKTELLAFLQLAGVTDESAAAASRPSPFVVLRRGNTQPPLFLIHPPGGGLMAYKDLAAALDVPNPVYGIESAALRSGRAEAATLEEMTAAYASEIRALQPDGPCLLGGWSDGGVLAAHVAAVLECGGRELGLLGLFDSYVPVADDPEDDDPLAPAAIALNSYIDLKQFPSAQLQAMRGRLQELPPEARMEAVVQLLVDASRIPADAKGMLVRLADLVRCHLNLLHRRPPPELRGPMMIWSARGAYPPAQLEQWQKLSRQPVRSRPVDADHYSILKPPAVTVVAGQLSEAIRARCHA